MPYWPWVPRAMNLRATPVPQTAFADVGLPISLLERHANRPSCAFLLHDTLVAARSPWRGCRNEQPNCATAAGCYAPGLTGPHRDLAVFLRDPPPLLLCAISSSFHMLRAGGPEPLPVSQIGGIPRPAGHRSSHHRMIVGDRCRHRSGLSAASTAARASGVEGIDGWVSRGSQFGEGTQSAEVALRGLRWRR